MDLKHQELTEQIIGFGRTKVEFKRFVY